MRHVRNLAWIGAIVIVSRLLAGPAIAADTDSEAAWREEWAALSRSGGGFLVWESNRTGRWRIWTRNLDGSGLRQLSPDESGRDHFAPHISPDGTRLVYLSYPVGKDGYDNQKGNYAAPLHLLDLRTGEDRIVAPNGRMYGEDRAAVWMDAHTLHYIDATGRTHRLDLDTGNDTVLTRVPHPNDGWLAGWLINRTMEYATDGEPSFSRYDLAQKAVSPYQSQEGCQPYFSYDGVWGFWMGAAGGPIKRINLKTREVSTILEKHDARLPLQRSYLYFPMLSADGRLLAFGASPDQHDHFRSDYDIFVAQTDPRTLDVIGKAVRYTFDPGTDRFPDVYHAQLALGYHEGEAPYTVALKVENDNGAWIWDFGDGASARGRVGKHRYEQAGDYDVVARRGETVVRGTVRVRAPKPPMPRYAVLSGDQEILVRFDEPVQLKKPVFRLASRIRIDRWRVGDDGESVVLSLRAPLDREDTLSLDGVYDKAEEPHRMPPQTMTIRPRRWPSDRSGLLFAWDSSGGDADGKELVPRGEAHFAPGGAMALARGAFTLDALAGRLLYELKRSNRMSVEATILPDNLEQDGPARIVTFSTDTGTRNFTLGQSGNRLILRVRTPRTGTNGTNPEVTIGRLSSGRPTHVLVTYERGRLRAYLNGEPVLDSGAVQGDFSNWTPQHFLFGDEWSGGRDWAGTLEGVALYNRVIGPDEARQNYENYRAAIAERRAANPLPWPTNPDEVVFLWQTGKSRNLVTDPATKTKRAYPIRPRGRAHLNRDYAMELAAGAYTADDVNETLLRALRQSNRLSVEAVLQPANLAQSGPARIVTFSTDPGTRNFTLGQEKNRLIFRLRTPRTGDNGTNPESAIARLTAGQPTHVLVTYEPGHLVAYLNGAQVYESKAVQGDFSNWTPQHLLFGDEWTGERDWAGTLEGIAIYSRVVGPQEARENAEAYRDILARREPVPEVDAQAKLVARSDVPTLDQIQPYREALVIYEYEVENVERGGKLPRRIRVAHWAILNGETLAIAAQRAGDEVQLHLEPFEANPQLESIYVSDTLNPDYDVPLYYDVHR